MEEQGFYLPVGTMLAERYKIQRCLGAGGFGITYEAFDTLNKFSCAVKEYMQRNISVRLDGIKVMPVSKEKRQEYEHGRIRFIEEAETLKRLSGYKSIVKITDYFDENNTSYFVMEYLDGVNLNYLVKSMGGKLPFSDGLEIICQVCDGLDILHTKAGILHRDISPENIMVIQGQGGTPEVKLIDFGSAKNITLTKDMSIVLKKYYAPIEQYSSKGKQGSYTDVYALACTFYFILTGKHIPCATDRVGGAGYTPLVEMGVGVSQKVSDAVDMALQVDAAMRIQNVRDFKKLLLSQEKALPSPAPVHISAKPRPYFDVITGMHKGQRFDFPPNTVKTLGRSKIKADICLDLDGRISRVHCSLMFDSEKGIFYIEDTNSVNGIYMDDRQLAPGKRHELMPGDQITFGNHVCEIKVGVLYG